MEHAERYKRAREFYDVVTGLWDSFADDASCAMSSRALFRSRQDARAHHEGKYLKVRDPLNIARPVQGWPVIVQSRRLRRRQAARRETRKPFSPAAAASSDGQKLYADIKGRMEKVGATPST